MNRPATLVAATVLLTVGLFAWLFVGPSQLGGGATYITVVGSSMEPHLSRGDMVLVRPRQSYEVGDVVAYRNAAVGKLVMHRIVERAGDRFTLQGDNNGWIDSYQPTAAEIEGAEWVALPGWGARLQWLAEPRNAAVLSALVAALMLGGGGARVSASRRRRRAAGEPLKPPRASTFNPGPLLGPSAQSLFSVLLALALGFGVLTLITLRAETARPISSPVAYEQQGEFQYHATSTRRSIYDGGAVQTGDPVFTAVAGSVPVQFDYTLATDAPADLTGSIALTLEVTDIRGWRRTIELQPESAFEGASASVSGVIDLVALRAMIDDLEASTGLRRDSYGVTVVPTVTVAGTVAGVAIAERFSPPLEFRLDAVQLYFTPTPGPASATPADALTPVAAGSVDVERTVPATVTALGREYAVTTLTRVGMIGGATAAGGALVVGLLMLFAQRADEATKIRSRYGALMVDADVDGVGEGYTVELKRCEDLVRVAERLGVPIMHVERAGEHWYLLRDADTLYRYRIAADQSEAEPKPPVRPAQVGADAGVHAGYPRVVSWPDLVEAGGDAL